MDKFNTLYKDMMKKLGGPSPSNQYAGMSVKFILEDINKAAKLVCEDAENEGFLKSLYNKIRDGVQTAMATSLAAFVKFGQRT